MIEGLLVMKGLYLVGCSLSSTRGLSCFLNKVPSPSSKLLQIEINQISAAFLLIGMNLDL